MIWKIVDQETGAENHEIHWMFQLGERVKNRILNTVGSDHAIQHPIYIHGERFLVLHRDGVPNSNLVWKDTVLVHTGETVETFSWMPAIPAYEWPTVTSPSTWRVE